MHRTMKADATIPPEHSLGNQQERFESFREEFNTLRPHDAIGLQQPAELYRRSSRQMPRTAETYDDPGHYVVRRVSRAGTVRLLTRQFFVATPLMEDYIGFEEVKDGIYDMYYCFYLIGRYHEREHRIEGVLSKVPVSRPMADAGWKSVTDV